MKTMSPYEKQAQKFLEKTGATLEIRFLKHGKYFAGDKEERDIFEVKLSRGVREYVFTYGDSIANYEKMICETVGERDPYFAQRIIREATHGTSFYFQARKYDKAINEMKEWGKPGESYRPSAYSILASLEGRMYCDNVDDFAEEFGYTKPSEAIKTFKAVKEQADELQKLFNDEELDELSEIN